MPAKSVFAIILNWNDSAATISALASLIALEDPSLNITVVDNGSWDDSANKIRTAYPDVEVIVNTGNFGYAGGNNVGIQYALDRGAEYICVMNNDVIVGPQFIAHMLKAFHVGSRIGVVTPTLLSLEDGVTILNQGAVFDFDDLTATHIGHGLRADLVNSEIREVDIASGCAMLVHRDVFQRVGLLPEDYFLYYEDAAWCLDVRRSGLRIVCQPAARAWHHVSRTAGRGSLRVAYYMTRNQLYFVERYTPVQPKALSILRVLSRDLLNQIGDIRRGDYRLAQARYRGVADYLGRKRGRATWQPAQ